VIQGVKRLAWGTSAIVVLSLLTPLLASCGGNGQISVSVGAIQNDGSLGAPAPVKQGDTTTLTVRVVNNGPSDAPGVSVRVDMPAAFRFQTTAPIRTDTGAARTQPLDARVGSTNPQWGFWDLAAPNSQCAGNPSKLCEVDISFTVEVLATPTTYSIIGRATGDNTGGDVSSQTTGVRVTPAPHLGVQAATDKTTLNPNDTVLYRLTITNTGSAVAGNIGVLISLPPALAFQRSRGPFSGNGSRTNPIDPVKGSVELFYGGFVLPAASSAGPGFVTIAFDAQVTAKAAGGMYTLDAQVTDDVGDSVSLNGAAPITISGATPSPQPAVIATPTAGA
jgi:uncharacterized repeat protein (TIGR01451 family)